MTTAHSPLPWHICQDEDFSGTILDSHKVDVTSVDGDCPPSYQHTRKAKADKNRMKANAALIVRAVNALGPMREALEVMLETSFDRRDAHGEFERLADLYYKEFGRLAPGKSEPMELAIDSNDEANREQYDKWLSERRWKAIDKAKAALALASGTKEEGK